MRIPFFKLIAFLALSCICAAAAAPVFAAGNVNDFEINNFQIDYYLSQDSEQRSVLKTVETISAEFPETDQNHGLERAIPSSYNRHPTGLQIDSVSNANNVALPYTTYGSNDNTVVRIGEADRYVHGMQTYKIVYTQHDVTRYFSDTNDDEFYWDTNGTEWAVPVTALTARVHIDDTLFKKLTDKQRCYVGAAGSVSACEVVSSGEGFVANATNLKPRENMTIAVGFQPHTFATYKMSLAETLASFWVLSLAITCPIAVVLVIWLASAAYRRSNRLAEMTVIVTEFLPPKNASVTTSGRISHTYRSVFSAQLIDLAVRHYIKIFQTREKSLFKPANYELEIIKDITSLRAEEQEVLKDIFSDTGVGARLNMETLKNNVGVSIKLGDNQQKLDKQIAGVYALRARDPVLSAWFKRVALVVLVAAVLTLSPWLFIAAITSFIIALVIKPLTNTGLELARYLKGLESYIKTAETERLRMLQSPEGAARLDAPIDTNNKRQMVKLYERVLPYAILFGQEKEWNKRLGQYYESLHESPTWYAGNNAIFNAAIFSAAMGNFSQAATYSAPTSASSGGSGGGGFSGGGGGGGGGGGW